MDRNMAESEENPCYNAGDPDPAACTNDSARISIEQEGEQTFFDYFREHFENPTRTEAPLFVTNCWQENRVNETDNPSLEDSDGSNVGQEEGWDKNINYARTFVENDKINNDSLDVGKIMNSLAQQFEISYPQEEKESDNVRKKQKDINVYVNNESILPENDSFNNINSTSNIKCSEKKIKVAQYQKLNSLKKEIQSSGDGINREEQMTVLTLDKIEFEDEKCSGSLQNRGTFKKNSVDRQTVNLKNSKNTVTSHETKAKIEEIQSNYELLNNVTQEDDFRYNCNDLNLAKNSASHSEPRIKNTNRSVHHKNVEFGDRSVKVEENKFSQFKVNGNTKECLKLSPSEKHWRDINYDDKYKDLRMLEATQKNIQLITNIKTDMLGNLDEMKCSEPELVKTDRNHIMNTQEKNVSNNFFLRYKSIPFDNEIYDLWNGSVEKNNQAKKSDICEYESSPELLEPLRPHKETRLIEERKENNKFVEECSSSKKNAESVTSETRLIEKDKTVKEDPSNTRLESNIKMDFKEVREFMRIHQIPLFQSHTKELTDVYIISDETTSQSSQPKELDVEPSIVEMNKLTHSANRKTQEQKTHKTDLKQSGRQKKLLWNKDHLIGNDIKLFRDQETNHDSADRNQEVKCSNDENKLTKYEKQDDQNSYKENTDENKVTDLCKRQRFRSSSNTKLHDGVKSYWNSKQEVNRCKPLLELSHYETKNNVAVLNKTFSRLSLKPNHCTANKVSKELTQMKNRCTKSRQLHNHRTTVFGNCSECVEIQALDKSHNSSIALTKEEYVHAYKDRRCRDRSKSKSVERTKRKHSNVSKKPAKPANRKVTFIEDSSVFSYDPEESILESFYHDRMTHAKKKEQNHKKEKNMQVTVISSEGCSETVKSSITEETKIETKMETKIETKIEAKVEETASYVNLGYEDEPLFDCLPDAVSGNPDSTSSAQLDEHERLLTDRKSTTSSKLKSIPGKLSELRRYSEYNAKRWFRESLFSQKKMTFKKMKSKMKK